MRDHGGFEHNLQSLRVVDELEEKYAEFPGLNLTFETREGILKHCSATNARALGELGRRFLERKQPGLEAQLANLADEIAYNNHDVDDGLRAGLLSIEDLRSVELFGEQYRCVREAYPSITGRRLIHEIVRRMINRVVTDLIEASEARLAEAAPRSVDDARAAGRPLIGFGERGGALHHELKRYLRDNLYQHYKVLRMTSKAQRVVSELFAAFMDDLRLLPAEHAAAARLLESSEGQSGRARAVADYIAGMTDRYAISEYERIFDPSISTQGSAI